MSGVRAWRSPGKTAASTPSTVAGSPSCCQQGAHDDPRALDEQIALGAIGPPRLRRCGWVRIAGWPSRRLRRSRRARTCRGWCDAGRGQDSHRAASAVWKNGPFTLGQIIAAGVGRPETVGPGTSPHCPPSRYNWRRQYTHTEVGWLSLEVVWFGPSTEAAFMAKSHRDPGPARNDQSPMRH